MFKASEFRQVGYFKSGGNDRIRTITFSPSASAEAIRRYAKALTHTPGSLSVAHFFPDGVAVPADGITLAASIVQANAVLYETPGLSAWSYAYMRSAAGDETFVDCRTQPGDGLCRR